MSRLLLHQLIVIASCIILSAAPSPPLSAQTGQTLEEAEVELKALFDTINSLVDDSERVRYGDEFSSALQHTLSIEGSFDYPFLLLSIVSKLTSSGETIRIFTWNIPQHSGENRFYGMIQVRKTPADKPVVTRLVDQFSEITEPAEDLLTPNRWYGAIYFKMIENQTQHGETFYTLLGWRGTNMLITSKLIEILSITPSGEVRFGKPVFCNYGEQRPLRILFSHSANATMVLRYEEQSFVTDKRWNARRKEFVYKQKKSWIIVCDRLIPANPQLEGQYEYYTPAGDVLDGFVFTKGCWNFIKQIDVRNPSEK
ncbi:hypothetical protein ACFLS7_00170 [Bacteroidota bacterium]